MSRREEHLKDEGSRSQVVLAGATAGLVSRFCVAPLDVIKIRLQLQSHSLSDPLSHHGLQGPIYKGTVGTLKAILREEGITGLWRGNIPAELLYVAYGAVQFTTYRSTTQLLHQLPPSYRIPSSAEAFVSGATGGTVATTLTYPLDLLRTRFAAQGVDRIYSSLIASVREIATNEGFRGFFQGLAAGVGQIVPYMGLFFAFYESLRLPLGQFSLPVSSGDAVAGMAASVAAKTVVFPLDTVRKRLQVQGPTRGRYVHRNIPLYAGGVRKTFGAILMKEGTRGLYRGLSVSLLKAAPTSAVTMWTYERALNVIKAVEANMDE
ncbi:MAG: mitochondrial thiamine pyrophosphate transporter [Bathelium mastoideum]|nr:MAG: mitochondrial thiamine pyrophosphate transporter [Bathelium mastoideum]KAI9694405.1 MAG: mitochondrial thiamine pyrophosphate transporter [Bathelium mastoideum]